MQSACTGYSLVAKPCCSVRSVLRKQRTAVSPLTGNVCLLQNLSAPAPDYVMR